MSAEDTQQQLDMAERYLATEHGLADAQRQSEIDQSLSHLRNATNDHQKQLEKDRLAKDRLVKDTRAQELDRMNKAVKDFLLFAFMGLLFGAMIGYLIACGYIGYRHGIPMDRIGFADGLRAAPWNNGNPVWWQHVLYLVGGSAALGMVALAALSMNKNPPAMALPNGPVFRS